MILVSYPKKNYNEWLPIFFVKKETFSLINEFTEKPQTPVVDYNKKRWLLTKKDKLQWMKMCLFLRKKKKAVDKTNLIKFVARDLKKLLLQIFISRLNITFF